ncbi:helix-turn-helix domain-containing protein [Rhizobium sp. CC1099]|uniref:helix-turn-helix domain-containing protein n=1 Tax=Rhizobium sp. CC1099 TaxID=3039160 RepID=UPI0024B1113A|nr:helix-turn-helix domain-containing protein [Rhizobium sp. CC1099]WFU89012.1 helix-turn-helix domain-containing protein [Rhizobium sp. CC1099]
MRSVTTGQPKPWHSCRRHFYVSLVWWLVVDSRIQTSAHYYARFAEPLDPDKGWQREDVQLAFAFGMKERSIRRLLSLKEVAELLAVSVSTIKDLVHRGELAYVSAGRGTERRHLTFAPDQIESFIKRHTTREYHNPAPTFHVTTRKSKADLALERALAGSGDFTAQYEARRAAAKAKKK